MKLSSVGVYADLMLKQDTREHRLLACGENIKYDTDLPLAVESHLHRQYFLVGGSSAKMRGRHFTFTSEIVPYWLQPTGTALLTFNRNWI